MKLFVAEIENVRVLYVSMSVWLVDKPGSGKHGGNADRITPRRNQKNKCEQHQVQDAETRHQPGHFWPEGLAIYLVMIEQTAGVSKIEHLTHVFRRSL